MIDLGQLTTHRPDNFRRLHDWFGVWAMYEPAAMGLYQQAGALDLRTHMADSQAAVADNPSNDRSRHFDPASRWNNVDGIAVIQCSGTMMKYANSMGGGTSTVAIRRAVRAAASDPSVKAIVIVYDTPGGTVAGTSDLASDIAIARTKKPVWSYGEDLCASAGYLCCSQADRIYANDSALIGSIGVYLAVLDTSGRAEALKIKVHLVKAGEFKGAGAAGTPITDQQLAEWQRLVNTQCAQFIQAVSTGRRMTLNRVKALADGRVHIGQEAVKLGLIDRVSTLDECLADLRGAVVARTVSAPSPTKGLKAMSTDNWGAQPAAATLQELEAAIPGASADFLLAQLRTGATVVSALQAHNQALQQRLAAPKISTTLGVTPPKVDATSTQQHGSGWEDAIATEMSANPRLTKAQAIKNVNRKFPTLREEFVADYNREHGRPAAVA